MALTPKEIDRLRRLLPALEAMAEREQHLGWFWRQVRTVLATVGGGIIAIGASYPIFKAVFLHSP